MRQFVETDLQQRIHFRRRVAFAALSRDRLAQPGEILNRMVELIQIRLRFLKNDEKGFSLLASKFSQRT